MNDKPSLILNHGVWPYRGHYEVWYNGKMVALTNNLQLADRLLEEIDNELPETES